MTQPIHDLSQWLESQKGETILIRKNELSTGLQQTFDIDQVTLQLDHITVITNDQNIDDYIPSKELVLHGEGHIKTAEGMKELPQNAYEIPLFGKIATTNGTNGLKVETEKATYDIYVQ
ncbi:hypothetical protein JCM9140_3073 [Halalkalibacter wakoensis JCM 9140]|uniref:Uncharacterized protein n=1 Tax=Halalkalibacter wakoensis JCM 9140 TaxID=1236970 RepID=W4Q5K3_9BACI|nr:hypothetical protein [Halalkalibacter wakoensis]GAE26963.1 hypothetical protein JCM9140_3073 [Halalkalibacter wakoensis JCM 9140]